MKRSASLFSLLFVSASLWAQTSTVTDPTALTVGTMAVPRSELEYSFQKNSATALNAPKSVNDYLPVFVDYKLKVADALSQRFDTLSSVRTEYAELVRQQLLDYLASPADEEREMKDFYDKMYQRVGTDGLLRLSHILVRVPQKASAAQQQQAKVRIDSIYAALQKGASFQELAKRCSDDANSAQNGGDLGTWIGRGQTLKEFEDVAFSLQPEQVSKPFLSTVGYHIVRLDARKPFDSYATMRGWIRSNLMARGLRERLVAERLQREAARQGISTDECLQRMADTVTDTVPALRNLLREYREGLMLFEYNNREVWQKVQNDEAALEKYYKKHKKQYKWDAPHFKGLVCHCRTQADADRVERVVRATKDETQWLSALKQEFSADSVLRVKVEQRVFAPGEDAYVDAHAFQGKEPEGMKNFPVTCIYGDTEKQPKDWRDVRAQVVTDCQTEADAALLKQLAKRYPVSIVREVVDTIRPADNNNPKREQ